jgi:ubiquinol-cytochrome c reductase cytochrome b subunit
VAIGAWTLTFYAVLLAAGADDIVARLFRIPVIGILRTLQILVLTLPFVVAAAALLVARALRAGTAASLGDLTRDDLHAGVSSPGDAGGGEQEAGPVRDQVIQLWRNPDDTWRWRWCGSGTELTGNEAYLSRDEAMKAAKEAYAGVPVLEQEPPEGAVLPPPRHEPGLRARLAAAAAWLTLFVLSRRRRDH